MSTPTTLSPLVRSFHHAPTGSWTHVIVDPSTRRAAIVDAVLDFDLPSGRISTASAQRVLEYVATTGLDLQWVLETHAHADHLTAGGWLADRTGARLGAGSRIVDVQKAFRRILDLEDTFATDGSQFDHLFGDGERFRIGELEAEVVGTPGHTPDSVAYRVGDALFVGDTLFAPDTGTARCDFPGGDAATLYRSIRMMHALPDSTRVFLCHDYPTGDAPPRAESDIENQKRSNIHVCATTSEAEYVALRTRRDATLAVPFLLWPAIQFNIRGGRLPPETDGRSFFKLPITFTET
jgi:glyoxylase-like metal-dependent hydrolase (beta-lactamase superfamily II)